MGLADDFSVVPVFERLFAELLFDLPFKRFGKPLLDLSFAQDMVGRDAGLSAVEEFAENDPLCREFDICRRVDDAWAFAAEFEDRWGEVLSRTPEDFPPYILASGEEEVRVVFLDDNTPLGERVR